MDIGLNGSSFNTISKMEWSKILTETIINYTLSLIQLREDDEI